MAGRTSLRSWEILGGLGLMLAVGGCAGEESPGSGLGGGGVGFGGVGGLPSGGVGTGGWTTGGATGCALGLELCAGVCVSLATDSANCGGCGLSCPAGQHCSSGSCGCPAGLSSCGGACVDLSSDAANCGACELACAEPQVCSQGVCSASCAAGETLCGRACVDLSSHLTNCGECGFVCGSGMACVAGSCACPLGLTDCGNACVSLASDAANCGDCGQLCPAGAACVSGTCLLGTGGQGTGGSESGGAGTGGDTTGGAGGTTGGTGGTGGTTGDTGGTGGTTGGTGGTGGTTGGTSGTGGSGDEWYPCDGDVSGYDATAIQSGNTWTVTNGGSVRYTGTDLAAAMSAAYSSLSSGRTTKQSVLIQGSGDVSADAQIRIPAYTIVNVCGTVNVTGSTSSSDRSPFYARGATNIDIPHVNITGNPQYGMFFREVSHLHLGKVDLRLNVNSSGLGVRIDNNPSSGGAKVTNIRIDEVRVESSGGHGVETYGVDGLEIGQFVGVDTGNCGLILNATINAEVGSVHCDNCAHIGTGYAAFRMANRNGRVGSSYPTNIRVGEIYARGGGRGIFCVSESGGATIARVDLGQTGNNAVLLENCYNVTIAAESGRIEGPGDFRIAARAEFPNTSDITISNLTFVNTTLNESPCGTNTVLLNNVFQSSADNSCR